jgi:hypothetical protein
MHWLLFFEHSLESLFVIETTGNGSSNLRPEIMKAPETGMKSNGIL